MNPKGKKFLSLFLVFSLVILSGNLYAKGKQGAKLVIMKKDGKVIIGELITVKEDSLLLLDTARKDVSVSIGDIKVIRIKEKSEALGGVVIGLLIGAGFTALVALPSEKDPMGGQVTDGKGLQFLWWGAVFVPIGMIIGGILGAGAEKEKKIQIEGMPPQTIKSYLDYLCNKARIRNYK